MAQRIALIVGLAFWLPLLRGELFVAYFSWPVQSPLAPLLFNGCMIAAAAAILIARTSVEHLLHRRPELAAVLAVIGSGFLLPFANLSHAFASLFTMGAMAVVARTFCLLGAAWGMAYTHAYPASQPRSLMLDVALAYTLSYLTAIPWVTAMNPGGVRSLCLIVSGCAWYTYVHLRNNEPSPVHRPPKPSPAPSAVPREIALLIVTYVTILVLSGVLVGVFIPAGYKGSSSPIRSLLSLGTALALVALALPTKHRPPNATPLFGGAIIILAGALLTMSGVEPLVTEGSHILTAGRRLLWVLFWILLARTCVTTQLHSVTAFGCMFPCAFALARIPVNILRIIDPAQHLSTEALYMASTWLSVLIMGCVMVLAWLEALRWHGSGTASLSPAQLDSESLCSRVSLELAASHGLTERERITLELLSRGYTVKRIADELCVSENTVRAHTKAIYRKIECHSKQELVDLVEQRMADG